MKLKLQLLEIKPYEARDGSTKYKYIFLTEQNTGLVGYSNQFIYEDRVVDEPFFSSAHAHEYDISRDVWEGKLQYKVII